jgi:tellurite resistance protein TerC
VDVTLAHWIWFILSILFLLGIDLYRTYRNPHEIKVKEAIIYSIGWIVLALLFNAWIYYRFGSVRGLEFLTGYLIEKSLSVDNLFIFLLIFSHFKVPKEAKHLTLFYGVLGAIIMRSLLIWGGITLVSHFNWIFIPFGIFLLFTGIRLLWKRETEDSVEKGWMYSWLMKKIPMTNYQGTKFLVYENHLWKATPLFLALILIEITDLIFALDSVPAILGITTEPFIVFTSNIFAILGLRSLFFALEGIMQSFYLLHYALAFILGFIGLKMILVHYIHIPIFLTFMIILASLLIAIIGSFLFPKNEKNA